MILDDIVPLLVSAGIGTAGEDLFWGVMPSGDDPAQDPDPTTAIYETPGPGGPHAKDGPGIEEIRLMAHVRAFEYEVAMAKALALRAALHAGLPATLDNTRYRLIPPYQWPFDVGAQDDAGRTIISCNYALTLRPP